MAENIRLANYNLVAFAATSDPERARKFYRDTLGLRLVMEQLPFALVFDANGTVLRVQIVNKVVPSGYTSLGWQVSDIKAAAKGLAGAGVRFERFPGMDHDELGIWSSPSGARVAWFKDPDGNILSIGQS
jgi:catechol 2,3-dioxygenase-like lactoylglutathione lyase family enzyme